jgi:hypothetical protein
MEMENKIIQSTSNSSSIAMFSRFMELKEKGKGQRIESVKLPNIYSGKTTYERKDD